MSMTLTRRLRPAPVAALVAIIAGLGAAAAPDGPAQDLDPRVDPTKVTDQPIPPLPHQVMLPLPPDHRIADDRADVPVSRKHWDAAADAIARGRRALRAMQADSGGWLVEAAAAPTGEPDRPSPVAAAVTALAVKALAQAPREDGDDDAIRAGLAFVRSARTDDGAYEGGALANYVTSTVVSALVAVDDLDLDDLDDVRTATTWLQTSQWDETEGLGPRKDWYGGAGYGAQGRPDLSNTQMMLEALYDAGMSPDEPAFQRALTFLARTQNLSAANPSAWAGDDGGFVYTPAGGGESMASEAAGEGRRGELIAAGTPRSLRSYGSMTYAGFKSMLYAGLSPDDVRVRAAFDWIRRHWTFDENPGLGQQGLYYYYHAMSRALRVAQQPLFDDIDGVSHNWREELIDTLVARQRPDGTWRNDTDRWLESEPALATSYAVLALEEALKPAFTEAAPRGDAADPRIDAPAPLAFSITCDPDVAGVYTGRVYVLCQPEGGPEPRYGPQWFSTSPFLSLEVDGWKTDEPLVITADDAVEAYPTPLSEWPRDTYQTQAVIRLNPDSPAIGRGPGNAYGPVTVAEFGAGGGGTVDLRIDRRARARSLRQDERVRLVELQSPMLSEFHGRPVTMRAGVVLPEGYDAEPDRRYPTVYFIGGFGSDHHMAPYIARRADRLLPRGNDMVHVVLDALCFGGHHAFADSANNGPRGTALVEELIPHLEETFRLVAAPHGRFVTGVSSGGWASIWLQLAYPDFFGGAWSFAPDPVDFSSFQLADIYRENANLYEDAAGRPLAVAHRNGEAFAWTRDFAVMERAYGDGGQLRSFEWVFSPRGADGLPRPLYDRDTGAIDPAVANAWKKYDIRLVLERDWNELGPKLAGKLHIYVGDRDTFYLHPAVVKLKATLEGLGSDAVVEIVEGADHSSIVSPKILRRVDAEMYETYRAGAAN